MTDRIFVDLDLCCTQLHARHSKKWGADDACMREHVRDFVSRYEKVPFDLAASDVADGFKRLHRKRNLDQHGVCVHACELLFVAQPEAFTSWLRHYASSTPRMSELNIRARVYGKASRVCTVDETRIILPLCSILAIFDCILPSLVKPFIDRIFVQPNGIFYGARACTQVLDITHGLHTVIEKSLDCSSVGAIGQADVKQFYDSLILLRIFRFLVARGLDPALAAACLRHQLFPRVDLKLGLCSSLILERSRGSLTGSRLAGLCARVPIEHMCYWVLLLRRVPSPCPRTWTTCMLLGGLALPSPLFLMTRRIS